MPKKVQPTIAIPKKRPRRAQAEKCGLRVSPRRTEPARAVCGRPGGYFWAGLEGGGLSQVLITACRYHEKQLERSGFALVPLLPLEEQAARDGKLDTTRR